MCKNDMGLQTTTNASGGQTAEDNVERDVTGTDNARTHRARRILDKHFTIVVMGEGHAMRRRR
jgi:hypothetical protein